ncbi:MAG: EAL domain-containing protein [Gammaproteobacteria bacterium]
MSIASVASPKISNPEMEEKVRGEITNLLYTYSRGIHLATLTAATLLAYVFYRVVGPETVLPWLGYVGMVELSRGFIARRFYHAHVAIEDAGRWLNLYLVGNVFSAIGWGAAGFILFPETSTIHQVLTAVVLVGVAAIAVPILSISFGSYVTFALIASGPVTVNLLWQGDQSSSIAGGICIVGISLLLAIAWRMHNDVVDALRARLAYADIAEEFDSEVTTRMHAEATLRKGEQRGRKQSYYLLDLAREESISQGDLPAALKVISEKASQAISCTRISIWFMEPDYAEFRCTHLYDNGYHDSAPGIVLQTGQNARFYRRFERMRTFAVVDTREDKRVGDFMQDYLYPYRVTSLLGAPIRVGGRVRGLIVHEHVGFPRQWSRDERMFASSLADFIALAVASSGRLQAQEQLRHLANYDKLTGLPNRAMFQDRISHAIQKSRRTGKGLALLFVDLDRFKNINDSLGHQTGDRVLRTIAKRLVRCVRGADTVARLGGDEFTVILDDLEDVDMITMVSDRILETVFEPIILSENEVNISCSIGVAHYPNDGDTPESLLQNADIAMYRAKEHGRNNYQFFTDDMHIKAMQHLARENELRKALQHGELSVHYQPQVDTSTGKTTGVEALVRWNHPDEGMLPPADFIPLAEETGLIGPLGEFVLREACAMAKSLQKSVDPGFHVAVNLSFGQFQMRNIPSLVKEVLKKTKLPAKTLMLEITESLAMTDAESNLQLLHEIKELGVKLVLDDFGTGNSSLSYLRKFPIDILKIDRAFIKDLETDQHDAAIARATIGLAKSLNLEIVAEGVETKYQYDWLRKENCTLMQGYYFSPAIPAEEIELWLQGKSESKKKKTKASKT